MRPNIEEIRNNWKIENPELVVNEQRTINQLLAYIDELENMPLVQTVVEQKAEIRRLRSAIIIVKSTEMYENPKSEFQIGWNSAIDAVSRRTNEILTTGSVARKALEVSK